MKNRIYLRALEEDDYITSVSWRNDNSITSLLGGGKYFVSKQIERSWVQKAINDNLNIRLAICTIESNLYIGNIYLTEIDYINRKANTQILIGNHKFWNCGYGTEAMLLLLDYAFNHKNLHKVQAIVLKDNIASLKMHKKLGYIEEGLLRENIYKDGKYKDQVILSLLKSEYKEICLSKKSY
ncbi:GNAT family protein [Prevotella amnii]|uniref:Acetyltransferase, GNAT family n=1 Tax=Prevotella amnii CRIS 21A-A TaxID=679191 RepID=E1GX49_9BACT|nr:GNAT family protein [Prevotella amnii]EFN90706.1 acetyltransferase, GNAT family [Prevotella amnii CRIS 21A-A]